jgi:hypothetical protein
MPQASYQPLTFQAFADLGIGHIAYVRRVRADEAKSLFHVSVAAEVQLFSVHSADGKPIMIAATWEAAMTNAWVNNLEPMMVH